MPGVMTQMACCCEYRHHGSDSFRLVSSLAIRMDAGLSSINYFFDSGKFISVLFRGELVHKRLIGPMEVSAIGFGCMSISHAYGPALKKRKHKKSCIKRWILVIPCWIPLPYMVSAPTKN